MSNFTKVSDETAQDFFETFKTNQMYLNYDTETLRKINQTMIV